MYILNLMDDKMKKYDIILFDVDGTLLDFNKTEQLALTNTLTELEIEPSAENIAVYSQCNHVLWDMLERGEIHKDELKIKRFRDFFNRINVEVDENVGSETYLKHLCAGCFFIEGAVKVTKKLSKTHRIAVTTNGIQNVQYARLKLAGLDKFFEQIFISDEIGYSKPQKEYFDYVISAMNIKDLNRVIIIGDSLTSDIKGGNNAQISTCWYNPMGTENETDSVCDYEIKSLFELEEIVK